jgi:inactivated superfamily I helicase
MAKRKSVRKIKEKLLKYYVERDKSSGTKLTSHSEKDLLTLKIAELEWMLSDSEGKLQI